MIPVRASSISTAAAQTQGHSTPLQNQSNRFWSQILILELDSPALVSTVKERLRKYGARSSPQAYIYPAKCKQLGPTSTLLHLFKATVGNTHLLCNTTAINALSQEVENVGFRGHVSLRGFELSNLTGSKTSFMCPIEAKLPCSHESGYHFLSIYF